MRAGGVRELVCRLLRLTGMPLLVRETLQRRTVVILAYHRLTPAVADRHFAVLRQHYTPIRLREFVQARQTNTIDRLPPKSLVVTIDDGHESLHKLKDVLLGHRFPVTVFLCSGFVETARRFWFSAPGLDEAERQRLKAVPDDVRLSTLRTMGFDEAIEFGERQGLDLNQIRELQGLVDFEAHSVTHPILTQCSDAKSQEEITSCRTALERYLDAPVTAFAYPNGSYSPREVAYVREAGYQSALTTVPGFNTATTPAYELKRFVVPDSCGADELLARACGIWSLAVAMRPSAPAPRPASSPRPSSPVAQAPHTS